MPSGNRKPWAQAAAKPHWGAATRHGIRRHLLLATTALVALMVVLASFAYLVLLESKHKMAALVSSDLDEIALARQIHNDGAALATLVDVLSRSRTLLDLEAATTNLDDLVNGLRSRTMRFKSEGEEGQNPIVERLDAVQSNLEECEQAIEELKQLQEDVITARERRIASGTRIYERYLAFFDVATRVDAHMRALASRALAIDVPHHAVEGNLQQRLDEFLDKEMGWLGTAQDLLVDARTLYDLAKLVQTTTSTAELQKLGQQLDVYKTRLGVYRRLPQSGAVELIPSVLRHFVEAVADDPGVVALRILELERQHRADSQLAATLAAAQALKRESETLVPNLALNLRQGVHLTQESIKFAQVLLLIATVWAILLTYLAFFRSIELRVIRRLERFTNAMKQAAAVASAPNFKGWGDAMDLESLLSGPSDEVTAMGESLKVFQEAISERERALLDSEKRFRGLIENLPNIPVVGYDVERRVTYWNEASARLYGYSREEALGRRLEELIIPAEMRQGVLEAIRNWREQGVPIPAGELELVGKGGRTIPVLSSHVMLYGPGERTEMFRVDVDLTEQKRAQAALKEIATNDQLTKLPNRYLLHTELKKRLGEAERFSHKLAILFIDLDDFKAVNDTLGHDYGDDLLIQAAKRISESVRGYDILARFGGDEFVLVMPSIEESNEVMRVAEKIQEVLTRPFTLKYEQASISASIGISLYPVDGRDESALLKNADTAMYRAKQRGRNTFEFFTQEMNDQLRWQQQIITQVSQALDRKEFHLVYQPLVDLETGCIFSVEALLRWYRSDGTPISPGLFIPYAEHSSLIHRIGAWVTEQACWQRAQWRKLGIEGCPIIINVSGREVSSSAFFERLQYHLTRHQLSAADVGIELTENILAGPDGIWQLRLRELRESGMSIAIDDFGSGFSSINYIKRFPSGMVKIDRELVHDGTRTDEDRAIMKAIVSMAHSLGLKVVAEGIETADQLALARELSCEIGQGFLLYEPMPADEVAVLLMSRTVSRTGPCAAGP